ncbi:hypothetical protein PAHAL_9G095200 [Panicum hallii]|uniref:Uncharacterized protein n=1 Tax=Panicum hallii TaxID=206008 RepID=A0A2T8I0T5_9POAL|nr:hypothetical protein PAHAL_9G095200 [Panicum hallii]
MASSRQKRRAHDGAGKGVRAGHHDACPGRGRRRRKTLLLVPNYRGKQAAPTGFKGGTTVVTSRWRLESMRGSFSGGRWLHAAKGNEMFTLLRAATTQVHHRISSAVSCGLDCGQRPPITIAEEHKRQSRTHQPTTGPGCKGLSEFMRSPGDAEGMGGGGGGDLKTQESRAAKQ